MDISSSINSLSGLNSIQLNKDQNSAINKELLPSQSFQNYLNKALLEVNETQVEGYNAMENIATGKTTNLQEAVQRIEEAELSLKLALEVKNKGIAAFREITRMQI